LGKTENYFYSELVHHDSHSNADTYFPFSLSETRSTAIARKIVFVHGLATVSNTSGFASWPWRIGLKGRARAGIADVMMKIKFGSPSLPRRRDRFDRSRG
jgi:hypothetical protein